MAESPPFEPLPGVHHLTEIENPELAHTPMRIEGIVSSTSRSYLVPREVVATWIKKGKATPDERSRAFNSFDPELLQLVGVNEKTKNDMLARILDAPRNASITAESHYVVYKVRLRPPVFHLIRRDDKILDEKGYEYKAFDVYIVTDRKLNLTPSSHVILTGHIRPDPKTQSATFMAVDTAFPEAVEGFDRDAVLRLRTRLEGMTLRQRVDWILSNFEAYSHIVGRRNLAYASLLTFFTPVWVDFDGDRQHGWGIGLLIGDTTTGKSETLRKMILLLQGGTYITAETATAVGLTAAAVKSEQGEWITDFGFLVLNDRKLLAVDGYHKLSKNEASKMAESERQGVVTKGAAAKGSAPARTRQIKICNAVDLDVGKYGTKAVAEFFYPIQTIPTVLDKTSIARLDIVAVSDQRTVKAEDVNILMGASYDPDLELLSEVLKWAWSDYADIVLEPEAVDHILREATRLYNEFYCDSIPLVNIEFKIKLARLSIALARATLSTTPDLKTLIVTREHVEEVVGFLEGEYIEAGLHAVAKSEVVEQPTEDDLNGLIYQLEGIGIDADKTKSILRFIVLKGYVTKDILKSNYSLADHSELRPLLAILQGHDLVKSGRGFYPKSKLIQLVRLIDDLEGGINSKGVKDVKRGTRDIKPVQVATIDTFATLKKDTPPQNVKLVLDLFRQYPDEVLKEDLVLALLEDPHGIPREEGKGLLEILARDGLIFQPRPGWYKLTGGS